MTTEVTNQDLKRKLDELQVKIDLILEQLVQVSKHTDTMTSHITFVNKVYNSVKSPAEFILNGVRSIMGSASETSTLEL